MFNEEVWNTWVQKESNIYELKGGKRIYHKKGYTHFDDKIWFDDYKDELKILIKQGLRNYNPKTSKLELHSFTPFLKMLVKTPRYRYQEDFGLYDLESKIRPICFASHKDSLIHGYYAYALTKKYEDYINKKGFEEVVLAYRSDTGNCNIQFAREAFDQVKNFIDNNKPCTAIALDIKGYFDNINHSLLKQKWEKVIGEKISKDSLHLFKSITGYTYVKKSSFYKKYAVNERKLKKKNKFPSNLFKLVNGKTINEKYDIIRNDKLFVTNPSAKDHPEFKGIPQGSAISALLSNIFLIDFDEMMYRKSKEGGFIYRRYCDDILIICSTGDSNSLKDFAIGNIKKDYKLTIQDKKAEIIDFLLDTKGNIRSFRRNKDNLQRPINPTKANEKKLYKKLQYLGFEFDGQKVFIRSTSISRYYRKMKARLDKTVSMAYGASGKGSKIKKHQIYERYTDFGKQNFLTYVRKAASKEYINTKGEKKLGLNSPAIREQLKRHRAILKNELAHKNIQRFRLKESKDSKVILKSA